MKIVAFH